MISRFVSDAKFLLRKSVYIRKKDFPRIDQVIDNENQLIDFQVIDVDNNIIGIIQSIDYNRVQPLIKIKKGEKEILAPYVDVFIEKIDINNKTIHVNFPDGLIEICSV